MKKSLEETALELVRLIKAINIASDDISQRCIDLNAQVEPLARRAGVTTEIHVSEKRVLRIHRNHFTRRWGIFVGRIRADQGPWWVGVDQGDHQGPNQTMSRDDKILMLTHIEELLDQWRIDMKSQVTDLHSLLPSSSDS